ncbi:hypothetical protein C455_12723 [Haloferax larsenii JCM 13917]|nr:hypothetical protein C455_12723 [Haloferax larsenii JCM 13917]
MSIHPSPQAAKACEDINARAFTVGNHIAFNHGEYDPSSAEGQHVLAHELAHVRQQTGGAVSMLPQKGELEIDPDERLEREAEETAQRVMRGGKIGVHRMQQSDVHVQRSKKYTRREFFTGEASASETAEAVDDATDPQRLLEGIVSQAKDIDWVSVFKKAGLAAAKTNPAAKATLTAADELDSQLRDDSVTEDSLIAQLEQRDPPQNWVKTIAQQAADIVQNRATGAEPIAGEGGHV